MFSLSGCSSPQADGRKTGQLLFSTIGKTPFSDSVWLLDFPTGHARILLSPSKGRSYICASGVSLRRNLLVVVHNRSGGTARDSLELFEPATKRWSNELENVSGPVAMSPDEKTVAFARPGSTDHGTGLWLRELSSGQSRQISQPELNEWDTYPQWRADSKRIAFIRLRILGGKIIASLGVAEPSSARRPSILPLHVAGAAYAHSGELLAVMTGPGLEIINANTMRNTLVILRSRMNGQLYRAGGGIVWSTDDKTIAFALVNPKTGSDEIWIAGSNGSYVRKLYGTDRLRISCLSFIAP